jgi:hypothetical protein
MAYHDAMKPPLLLSGRDLEKAEERARSSMAHAAEIRAVLGGRFHPDVADFYALAPISVHAYIGEIRRLRGELQQALKLTVAHVDAEGRVRAGDVTDSGKSRRGKRRNDVNDAPKQGRRK